jgi:peptidoglycan biosynthesis protein MviN/MurJ (putative lipid II flippase)
MLSIFVLIGVATSFARIAFDKNLNRGLWGTIGVLSYFVSQFVITLIIASVSPETMLDNTNRIVYSLLSGIAGVAIAYVVLQRMPDGKDESQNDSNLLDGDIK